MKKEINVWDYAGHIMEHIGEGITNAKYSFNHMFGLCVFKGLCFC